MPSSGSALSIETMVRAPLSRCSKSQNGAVPVSMYGARLPQSRHDKLLAGGKQSVARVISQTALLRC